MTISMQQLGKYTTVLEPLLVSGPRATMDVLLEAVFSMWSAPRLYHLTNQVGWWVSEVVRGLLWFSPCELLLLEAGSWGTGIVWEPGVRGTSAVGDRDQAMTHEDTADWLSRCCSELLNVWISVSTMLLVVTICKDSVNLIINSNPIYALCSMLYAPLMHVTVCFWDPQFYFEGWMSIIEKLATKFSVSVCEK
jgi:hypothetical protein